MSFCTFMGIFLHFKGIFCIFMGVFFAFLWTALFQGAHFSIVQWVILNWDCHVHGQKCKICPQGSFIHTQTPQQQKFCQNGSKCETKSPWMTSFSKICAVPLTTVHRGHVTNRDQAFFCHVVALSPTLVQRLMLYDNFRTTWFYHRFHFFNWNEDIDVSAVMQGKDEQECLASLWQSFCCTASLSPQLPWLDWHCSTTFGLRHCTFVPW